MSDIEKSIACKHIIRNMEVDSKEMAKMTKRGCLGEAGIEWGKGLYTHIKLCSII